MADTNKLPEETTGTPPASKKHLLHDIDIREPLFLYLEETFGRVRIIEEKILGHTRADALMITEGALTGLEIKSDADTYARLARQIPDYDRFCDFNFAVVGTSHALHVNEHLPDHWGIITVEVTDGKPDFYMLRKPQPNPNMVWSDKIKLLWRPELNHILAANHLPAWRNFSKKTIQERILNLVEKDVLARQFSEELFERDYTKIREEIDAYHRAHGLKKRRNLKKKSAVKARRRM